MAQYLVLIYGDEKVHAEGGPQLWEDLHQGHVEFGTKYEHAIAGGNALQDTSTATSVRKDGAGKFLVTDGPFTETKEALGGYYLIDAADLDEAIAIAKDVPMPSGGVEVRPILAIDMDR